MGKTVFKDGVYMNREYSWLLFNDRVLQQAQDESVPLFERCKFLSIFTSNLDEFYMVRVGSLHNQAALSPNSKENKTKLTAKEQIDGILEQTKSRYKRRAEVWRNLKRALKDAGIKFDKYESLSDKHQKQAREYYRRRVLPYLSPLVIDPKHPMLRFNGKQQYLVYDLEKGGKSFFGLLPVPENLPRIMPVEGGKKQTLVLLEDLVSALGVDCFTGYSVRDRALVRVTRNADFETDESDVDSEFDYDFSKYLKSKVDMRASLCVVRMEIDTASEKIRQFLLGNSGLKRNRCFTVKDRFDYKFLFELEKYVPSEQAESLKYPPFKGRTPDFGGESILDAVMEKDILLSYPFDSMETTFVKFLNECAVSDKVRSIKITIYRLSRHSKVADALLRAKENGKEVTVVIELLARFDEESNMYYAELLAEAGCTVIYGTGNYKVHSKIVSVVLGEGESVRYITHIGTGNYNEGTAKQYTDLNILTANEQIGKDAAAFFRNLAVANTDFEYEKLLVAPSTLKEGLVKRIEKQTETAKLGGKARIRIKVNSLTDKQIIEKFIEASQAGVKIELVVRGICCLIPGIEGKTENITVKSIVGRFLEHSRIYCFGDGEDAEAFISSADLMTRNIEKRVEIAAPVLDGAVKERILKMMDIILSDNVKGRVLGKNGKYEKQEFDGEGMDSQEYFLSRNV